ncbi:hypothetical protein [Pseudomonas sp. RT6P73]
MKEHDNTVLKDIVDKDVFLFALHIDARVTINETKYVVRNKYFHRLPDGNYTLEVSLDNPHLQLRLTTDNTISKAALLMRAKNGDYVFLEEDPAFGRPAGYHLFGAISGTITGGEYVLNSMRMFPEFP